jgi:hypothetical protein
MTFRTVAAFALIAASSLHAQTLAPASPIDLSTATPIAGSWTYSPAADGSEAVFLNASAQPQLIIHCSRAARRVTISRPAMAAAPFLFVWTSSQTRNLPASFNPAIARISAGLSAYDPLLDAIAFSRGRVGISVSGQAALVVPAGAEVARVVEDCRA